MTSLPRSSDLRLTVATGEPLTADGIESALNEQLDAALSTRRSAEFAQPAGGSAAAATFEEAAHVLELFVCGLSGRRMKLDIAARAYSDTETLFLPPRIALNPSKNTNSLILNTIVTPLWAQNRFDTFNADLQTACDTYADPRRALDLLNYLETLRLEACVARALPGLAREMAQLRGDE